MAGLREGVEDFTHRHEGTKRRVGRPTPKSQGIPDEIAGLLLDSVFMARFGLGLKEVKRSYCNGLRGRNRQDGR